jgi:hypothetical protein
MFLKVVLILLVSLLPLRLKGLCPKIFYPWFFHELSLQSRMAMPMSAFMSAPRLCPCPDPCQMFHVRVPGNEQQSGP